MNKKIFWALCLCVTSNLFAQQTNKVEQLDSVYLDTKTAIARKNSGKVIATITSETLERSAGKTVAQLVNEVSGIEINGSRSNDGQNLGYSIRGGRNRQVVIMVDGVQLNDPSAISNDFDLRLLSASSIDHIEIIKGASSVLYGSGAATAVISITTKKASKEAIAATITSTLGTNSSSEEKDSSIDEITNSVSINGTLGRFFYNAHFSNRYVDGLSAVAAPEGSDAFEADTFNRFNTKLDLGYKITDRITVNRFIAVDDYQAGFDDFSFNDANNETLSDQVRTGGRLEWKYNKGSLVISDNHSWLDREIVSSFPTKFDARTNAFDAYANYRVTKQLNVLAGVNANFSRFNSFAIPFGGTNFELSVDEETAQFDIIDPYVNVTYVSDFGLNVNAGARLNNHSNYGTHLVYNVNPSYNFELGANTLKLLGSYSTAYITPSLFQLHDPSFGNTELEPEENTTIEGGLVFSNGNDFRVSAVYFNRNEENFVDFVTVDPDNFIFQYQNISEEFEASGVEVELYKRFGTQFAITANYTNTQADERFNLRIPEHKANASLLYTPSQKLGLGLTYQYNSEREDAFFNSDTFMSEAVTLDSFGLLGLNGSYQINDTIKVFANFSNLLNEEYEELFRFQTRGRNARLGFTLTL